ncbi:MAG: LuxR C-terminal-related transcriptional regulator [Rhodobacteraceae bacterium]|nr:LuxR C-terminal-related transcriptional regulator [Paracoccaceae bacterium]
MTDRHFVALILVVQVACAFFFLSDIFFSVVGFSGRPIAWEIYELLQIGAAVGLVLAVVLGAIMLRRTLRRQALAEERLRRASGAFYDLLNERFADWNLTPAEADVALFAIKGMSTAEIAALRRTSEGTVKAQTAAIYRKAGVAGRPQLLSLFIEDLMDGTTVGAPAGGPAAEPGPG